MTQNLDGSYQGGFESPWSYRMSENEDYSNYECPHPHDPDMYDFDLQRFFLIIIFDILISKKFFT